MKRPWWAECHFGRCMTGATTTGMLARRAGTSTGDGCRKPPDVAPPDDLMDALESSVSPDAPDTRTYGLLRLRSGREEVSNTTERRAEFVYEAARLAAIATRAPIVPAPWLEREDAFRRQFLNVIKRQMGDQRSHSPEELHGSWMEAYFAMGWKYGEVYDREAMVHPDLVPYSDLGQLERDKDAVFVALCEIARQWIYELAARSAQGGQG